MRGWLPLVSYIVQHVQGREGFRRRVLICRVVTTFLCPNFQEADMIVTGLTITKERLEAVDFTYPFWEEPSAVVVRVWDHKEAYFYKPLQGKVTYHDS